MARRARLTAEQAADLAQATALLVKLAGDLGTPCVLEELRAQGFPARMGATQHLSPLVCLPRHVVANVLLYCSGLDLGRLRCVASFFRGPRDRSQGIVEQSIVDASRVRFCSGRLEMARCGQANMLLLRTAERIDSTVKYGLRRFKDAFYFARVFNIFIAEKWVDNEWGRGLLQSAPAGLVEKLRDPAYPLVHRMLLAAMLRNLAANSWASQSSVDAILSFCNEMCANVEIPDPAYLHGSAKEFSRHRHDDSKSEAFFSCLSVLASIAIGKPELMGAALGAIVTILDAQLPVLLATPDMDAFEWQYETVGEDLTDLIDKLIAAMVKETFRDAMRESGATRWFAGWLVLTADEVCAPCCIASATSVVALDAASKAFFCDVDALITLWQYSVENCEDGDGRWPRFALCMAAGHSGCARSQGQLLSDPELLKDIVFKCWTAFDDATGDASLVSICRGVDIEVMCVDRNSPMCLVWQGLLRCLHASSAQAARTIDGMIAAHLDTLAPLERAIPRDVRFEKASLRITCTDMPDECEYVTFEVRAGHLCRRATEAVVAYPLHGATVEDGDSSATGAVKVLLHDGRHLCIAAQYSRHFAVMQEMQRTLKQVVESAPARQAHRTDGRGAHAQAWLDWLGLRTCE